jgi:hypothetical protein
LHQRSRPLFITLRGVRVRKLPVQIEDLLKANAVA